MQRIQSGLTLLALALWAIAPGVARAEKLDKLDEALKNQAPEVIKYLRGKNYHNVGVLKFLVQKGNDLSDNVGPLNLSLANRLEVALALANPDEELGIIERASAAVAKANNRRANHRTREGRQALFDVPFVLAWGNQEAKADAFVTGVVILKPEQHKLTVTIQAFGRQSADLDKVCTFSAALDTRTLAEAGQSFLLKGARGAFDDDTLLAKATESSSEILTEKEPFPLIAKESPVELKLFYDSEEIPVTGSTVKEPKEGQSVSFTLKNLGREVYGVVLMVNGENTIYREKMDPRWCHKWILDPGEQIKVHGFQMSPTESVRFRVLSPEQSEKDEVSYNEHAGTFTLVVFRNWKSDAGGPPALVKNDETQQVAAISRGALTLDSKPTPSSLKVLQSRLKKREADSPDPYQRGYVVPGKQVENEVKRVEFKSDPVPLMSATIRYYQAKGSK